MSDETAQQPVVLLDDLRHALERDEFYLVYQPEIDLQSGRFSGVEALIRWRHPSLGVIQPATFLPLLETSGLIVDVGRWALISACYQGAEWHDKGYRFSVAVNASLEQLLAPGFTLDVVEALDISRLDPSYLTLELSSHDVDSAPARSVLARLRDLGVLLALDDVTPQFPTLDTLEALGLSIVKLDRRYVAGVAQNPDAVGELEEYLGTARRLGLHVIATGVEDDGQRELLRAARVDVGQGFHFARPYDVNDIDRFLEDFALFSGRPL